MILLSNQLKRKSTVLKTTLQMYKTFTSCVFNSTWDYCTQACVTLNAFIEPVAFELNLSSNYIKYPLLKHYLWHDDSKCVQNASHLLFKQIKHAVNTDQIN